MLNLIILLILLWRFYIGVSRGLRLQLVLTVEMVIASLIALVYFKPWSAVLQYWVPFVNPRDDMEVIFLQEINLFSRDDVFYYGVSFLAALAVAYLILRLITLALPIEPSVDISQKGRFVLSGFLSVLVACYLLVMISIILATIPATSWQNRLASHGIISFFIDDFPVFSSLLKSWWIS